MKKSLKSILLATILASVAIAGESDNFGGLGISIWLSKNGVRVAGVIPNSPAENMGLQAGDVILSANGVEFSSTPPQERINYLRGEAGSSIDLIVERYGEKLSLSTKRVGISVKSLEAGDISGWYGKSEGLTEEEISNLASQKTNSGYEYLGAMQNGMPIVRSAENLNASNVQLFSMKKAEENLPETKRNQNEAQSSSLNNASFVNAKGAQIKLGNVPVYRVK
jgi:membrane-associated protease RseP (regulator of RpoE activity)